LGIPYTNEDLGSFFFGGPVNDIMSVLRLVAYPLDKVAYAEMLRSPFAGLSLPGLSACLSAHDQCQQPFSDMQSFSDEPLSLAEADRFKYLQGQKIYRLICDKARRESVSSLVSELWYGQGYRYETEWNPEVLVYRELYDYLFHLAAKADAQNMGLASFTDYIQALRNLEEKLEGLEIPLERPSAVQLLTIHKSKGLEFPVVFLCCCGYKSRGERSGAVYDSGDAGISVAPPPPPGLAAISGKKIKNNFFWERSRAESEQKRTAELRRLLYVGMTRAENELYLSGCLKLGKNDKDKLYDKSLALSAKINT
jgi:ATP-dependent helicase/nuclease subunit A